jgi:SAM-dependent methyltransferase
MTMPDVDQPSYWQQNYRTGRLQWDLGGPAPVFQRLADSDTLPPGRMIVLGAGLGHDARLFARHGFQVTALDFAPGAVAALRDMNASEAPVAVLQADFFDLHPYLFGHFDYVLDYVFYCAIDPQRRPQYADIVTRLLAISGLFIILAFPLGDRQGGPPFAVSSSEIISLFQSRGLLLEYREEPSDSVRPRRGREELLLLRKKDEAGTNEH